MRILSAGFFLVMNIFLTPVSFAQSTDLSHNNQSSDRATGAVLVPWSFIERWVSSQGAISENSTLIDEIIKDINFIVSEVPVRISEARLQVRGGFAGVQVEKNVTRWQSHALAVDVIVSGFEVEKQFSQDVGGATIIVSLKAKCQPFSIHQVDANFVTDLAWKSTEMGFDLSAQALKLHWPENSWQIGSVSCEGPQGFGDIVQSEIRQLFKNPTTLETHIKPVMEHKLNTLLSSYFDPLKNPKWLDNNKVFSVKTSGTEVVDDRGLVILMDVQTNPEYQGIHAAAKSADLTMNPQMWEGVQDQPLLVLPLKLFENAARHAKIFPRVETHLNEIAGFKNILNNRLLQFFFWPELRKFKKDSPFDATSLVQGQDFAFPENAPSAQFVGGRGLSISASISTWIRAVRDGQAINWAYVNTQVKGVMNYSLQDGEMQFSLKKPELQMTARHMPEYLQKYPNKHKFPISRLKSVMQQQLSKSSFKFSLPALDLQVIGAQNKLRAVAVREQSDYLVFSFEPILFQP